MGVRLLEESCPVGFGPRIPDDDGLNACGVRGTQAGKRVLEDERLIGAHAEGLEREVVDLGSGLMRLTFSRVRMASKTLLNASSGAMCGLTVS